MKKFYNIFLITFIGLLLAGTSIAQPLPCPPSNTTTITAGSTGAACSGACTRVYTSHSTTLKSTSSYTLTDIPYLPTTYTGGTPILVGIDDIFSDPVDLPFEFCFYGTKYTQCLIGANGQICFDLSQAGAYDPWPISSPIPAGNNTGTLNCIMGAYYDIDPGEGGNISWAVYGTAPCRTFVVSWANVPLFDASHCPGLIGTQQIVLYESTYAIDIFIQSRPLCTSWNSGFGTVGIEDASGTNYMTYPGYNGSAWSANNFACRFTPNAPATWTFTWTDPSGAVIATTDTAVVCPNVATTYTVRGVASSNCDSIVVYSSTTVDVGPSPVIGSITNTRPSYCGATDGTWTIGGLTADSVDTVFYTYNGVPQPPFYVVVPPSGTITQTGLAAGDYSVYVKVGPCTSNIVNTTIIQPPPPDVTVDSIYVKTCVGVPVQLHSYATPPGFPYVYSWSPTVGLSDPNISNPVVTPAMPGDVLYTISVNPTPSIPTCAGTASLTVHTIGDFSIVTPPDTICLLNPRVQVPVTISGSNEISYVWAPAADVATPTSMNPVITPNTAGIHIYTVTGSYAHCPDYVHTYRIIVDEPATGLKVRDTICLGMSDIVDMSASGGAGYHYMWTSTPTGVTFSNDTIPAPVFTPPAVGAYTLAALVTSPSNAAGCGTRDSVFLLVLPNALTVSPTDTAICLGQVLQVTGNLQYSNIFTYQWLPTAGIPNSTVLNALITPDTSQIYTVVASFHRCPDIYATLNLDVQPNPSVYLGGNRTVCQFDTLHLHPSVGPAWYSNYSYTWTPATALDATTGSTVIFSSGVSTMVAVTVSTPAGCTGIDSAFITVNPGNFASVTPVDSDFCPHESRMVSVTSTETGTTFRWIPSMYVSDSMSASPVISPITTQTYTIVATTVNGCTDTVLWTATVYPDALVELGDSVSLYPGESYTMDPSTNCVTFNWFPVTGLSSPFISNPVTTPDVSTIYILTGTTEHGCVASDSISVIVNGESLVAMPNAFTPGTGTNNTFKVLLRGIANLNYFRVYNRWGNLMFETKNINEGWDGTYKAEPQQMGVYVYDVQVTTLSGKVVQKTGNVTLLR